MALPKPKYPERNADTLRKLAGKYIWWKTPEEALLTPDRVIAQVMDIGDWADILQLLDVVDEEDLRNVLRNAEAGYFRPRSWHYWHYRLGLAEVGRVPPLPRRSFN